MRTILVTGASGNVGRPLVTALTAAGVTVRAVTREATRTEWPRGVDVVAPASLPEALDGVDAVFVNPRAAGPDVTDLLDLAHRRRVRRAVALSAINVDDPLEGQPSRHRGDRNREVETAVMAWPGETVALRPTLFAGNTVGLWAHQLRGGDRVHGPYAAAGAAPIDERDVAAVAACALLGDDELLGRRVPLTGPRALTQREMLAEVAAALGRPLEYVEVEPATVRHLMIDRGFPAPFVDAYLAMQAAATEVPAPVTDDVARILGRPATTFREWARHHVEAFRARRGPATATGQARR